MHYCATCFTAPSTASNSTSRISVPVSSGNSTSANVNANPVISANSTASATTSTPAANATASVATSSASMITPVAAKRNRRKLQATIGGVPQEAPQHATASAIPPEVSTVPPAVASLLAPSMNLG